MKSILLAGALLAAIVLLAGCTAEDPKATIPQKEEGRYIIHMSAGNHFGPMHAQVPVNSTVRWVQDDPVPHDVTDSKGNPPLWQSPRAMQQGTFYDRVFATVGTFEYECTIHASTGMKGTLEVVAA
jgi:plastocyanin